MGFAIDDNPNSTPKLTLSKIPYYKPRGGPSPPPMQTPPLRPPVSVPFRWEEAPGKPRASMEAAHAPPDAAGANSPSSKNKVARCLDLPPRLIALHHDDDGEGEITIMPSSITMLDGPYVGRSMSLACTFSFRKGPVSGREEGVVRSGKRFGSGRWGSFRDNEKFVRGSFDFSHSLGEFFKREEKVKITRVGRRRSFLKLSSVNSNLLADIYASFKQAVPWRRSRR